MHSFFQTSPYKKFKTKNNTWVSHVKIRELQPHVLYKITDIEPSTHHESGNGYRAFINCKDEKKLKVQLPGKYLRTLNKDDIAHFLKDISNNHPKFWCAAFSLKKK